MLVATLWLVAGPALAQMEGTPVSAPAVYARSAVLMNPTTGEILFAKEPHLRLPPASTTKILTALVTLERLDLNARVPVSPQAASAPPSRIGLHAGEAALTQDLLYGLMLKSGNDAAETLAEAAGGSIPGFAELMNAKASQIGARDSHFMNPHGLPNEDHYSTAYDLALIFRQAMNHPMFADIVGTRSAALRIESGQGLYGDRMVPVVTHNRLLASYEGSRGGKTGFTFKARRCFVGEVDRGGVRLIVAILNSPNSGTLWQDARALLDYGFARYGLAPRPPVQPEPVPVMVRQEPAATPAARVAMLQREPAARVAMVRPAMAGKRGPAMSVKADKTTAAVKAHGKPAVAAAKPASVSAAGKHQKGKPAPVVAAKTDKADRRPAATKVARVEPPNISKQKNTKRRI
ncbi:MAG: D-alanyl-D-alanine carboxypeptidase family protein [Candidatus Competibacter sp.]|nr:D-alanyl-D-alanine carboxypeptidase family protein [Candidatus Competibacter sp.]